MNTHEKTTTDAKNTNKLLGDHATAWTTIFETRADARLSDFEREPLDKKTAVVCTAFRHHLPER